MLFLAGFGTRGLASVVLAIHAVESLEGALLLDEAVGVVAMTVTFSVVLHGVTAVRPGRRYARVATAGPSGSVRRARTTSFGP